MKNQKNFLKLIVPNVNEEQSDGPLNSLEAILDHNLNNLNLYDSLPEIKSMENTNSDMQFTQNSLFKNEANKLYNETLQILNGGDSMNQIKLPSVYTNPDNITPKSTLNWQ